MGEHECDMCGIEVKKGTEEEVVFALNRTRDDVICTHRPPCGFKRPVRSGSLPRGGPRNCAAKRESKWLQRSRC